MMGDFETVTRDMNSFAVGRLGLVSEEKKR